MTQAQGGRAGGRRISGRLLAGLLVAAGVLLVVLANAHLLYVAFGSQPECVSHLKGAGEVPGAFRAAKSSC